MTIFTKFNPKDLPRWAQHDIHVVQRCERELAFRCDVCSAQTRQMRAQLKREAKRAVMYK